MQGLKSALLIAIPAVAPAVGGAWSGYNGVIHSRGLKRRRGSPSTAYRPPLRRF